ncbi:hypothetical protein ASE03_13775 [Kitasatospora sp. Root187]|nr:hypothetical protein ASC99_09605 [Kitasatospora sp. Root107]KRB76716.1 hypothetical protein ASE03_13775 [Kitasatospora sp. Root187]
MRSKYPDLSAGQVINRLIKSAVVPDGQKLPNDSYGYGIASPQKALAANPAVDNGPKENPLLTRPESQRQPEGSSASPQPSAPANGSTVGGNDQAAAPKSDSDSGVPVYVWAIVGLLAVVVVGGVIVLARRNKGGGGGGQPPYGGGGGAPQPQYPPQQPYGAPQPPQQPYGGNPQQYPPQQYPPQPGGAGGGNPYR